MATVKTIKPAGGGDYTTLAAWWTARKGSGSADEWAECYGGGDMGPVNLTGLTGTPDATHYIRIYAANGESPYLNAPAGVGINNPRNYTRIEGIKVYPKEFASPAIQLDGDNDRCERCVVDGNGTAFGSGIFSAPSKSHTIRNCIAINCSFSGINTDGATEIQNCTVYGCGSGVYIGDTTNAVNVVSVNCTLDFEYDGSFTGTVTYCASSDSTADDEGGTGNIVGQTATDLFTNPGSGDFTPKAGSNLLLAGADLSSDFTTDMLGTTRPAGRWDIGAIQVSVALPPPLGGGASGSTMLLMGVE